MGRKLPIKLTFAYILCNIVYGLISVNPIYKDLIHSTWWLIHGSIILLIFIITSNSVFENDLKISLRVIGIYVFMQSIISIIDIYSNVTDLIYSIIVILYFISSLTYWKYDRRRTKKS